MARSVTFVCVLLYTSLIEIEADCPTPWKIFQDYCYALFGDPLPWQEAVKECKAENAYLADVTSQAESEFLKAMARNYNETELYEDDAVWLGGSDLSKEGEWRWVGDGSSFNFTDWHIGEPNNYKGNENCLDMYRGQEGLYTWRDERCTWKYKYICKYLAPMNPGFG